MNLEDSKISQSQNGKYCVFSLHEAPRVVKVIKTGSRSMVARGWREERNRELVFSKGGVSVW